jgi:putative ABC transport system ATP-binding protein
MLQLDAVSKSYRDTAETVRAVRDVSLSVEPGEMVGLFGPSGSGKTTLLLLAAGILPPDSGRVCVGGTDISDMSESETAGFRLSSIGFVFQNFLLLDGLSAIDNASLGLLLSGMGRRDAHARVMPLLERLGVGRRAKHLPPQLSGGERQRVAIAKALARNPRLVLADEPTGNLDSHRTREVLTLLATIAKEMDVATLLVSHDAEAESFTDRAYHMSDGGLVDQPVSSMPDAAPPLEPQLRAILSDKVDEFGR